MIFWKINGVSVTNEIYTYVLQELQELHKLKPHLWSTQVYRDKNQNVWHNIITSEDNIIEVLVGCILKNERL